MTTACMSRSWKVKVKCAKEEKIITRRDDQSAISSKEHVKYEATQTYLSVTYQHDRLHLTGKQPQPRSQGPQQQQSTPPIFLQRVFSGEKNTKQCDTETNACRHWFIPWILFTYYHIRGHRLTTGGTCIIQPSRPLGRSHSQCCCIVFLAQ